MRRFAVFFTLASALGCALPSAAQGSAELMKTPDCLAARRQLDEALAAGGPRARLDAAREQAALKCFGVKPPPPPEGRFLPPPAAADSIRPRPEPTLPRSPAVAGQSPVPAVTPPPPVAIPRAPALTSCDATGCWDSNGARHNQQGPVLVGPRGMCTVQGGLLQCP